jgi:hypothetical protein
MASLSNPARDTASASPMASLWSVLLFSFFSATRRCIDLISFQGDAAQGMYAVLDGTHSSENCCFDYGNSESTTANDGAGHREAIHFGSAFAGGTGSGPWIEADLENGLFTGPTQGAVNVGNPTIPRASSQQS